MSMDCFNINCPFRVNETSSCNYCACLACPNRDNHTKNAKHTNADRIRAMTDEELAKFIAVQRAFYCTFEDPLDKDYPKMLNWLKQEVDA